MKRHIVLAIVSVATIAALPLACGGSKESNTPPPSFAPAVPVQSAQTAPTATAQPTATATAQPAQSGPVVSDPGVGQLITAQLVPLVSKDARGMKPSGDMIAGMLQEGQYLEQNATLQPGKCYTIVGLGLPGIQELDIVMSPAIPLQNAPLLPLAQDNQTGSQATVAPQPDCYKYVMGLPLQVKITVIAKSGSGPAGAQLYVK